LPYPAEHLQVLKGLVEHYQCFAGFSIDGLAEDVAESPLENGRHINEDDGNDDSELRRSTGKGFYM
jgi:hypothetical protein